MKREIYPMETSSNTDEETGLSDADQELWSPDKNDTKPSVSITVDDDDDKYIDSVTLTETENVGTVTIVVINKDGTEVSCFDIVIHL